MGKRKRIVPSFYESFHVSQEYKEHGNISKSQELKIKIIFYFPEGISWFFNVIVLFKGICLFHQYVISLSQT